MTQRIPVVLKNDDEGSAVMEPLSDGRHKLTIVAKGITKFTPTFGPTTWVTSYPVSLVERFLEVKRSDVINELRRDEDPDYVGRALHKFFYAHFGNNSLSGARILDFGCHAGASLCFLSRKYPKLEELVGVELDERYIELAEARAHYHKQQNIRLLLSPSPTSIPSEMGQFDIILINAVVEHMFPKERQIMLPLLWDSLRPGGTMMIHETPYRWFPIEVHTTMLPLLNYLPDRLAFLVARAMSSRVPHDQSWETLLRRGIRGSTIGEILNILSSETTKPEIMIPQHGPAQKMLDLWYFGTDNPRKLKQFTYALCKIMQPVYPNITPWLSVALRKPD